MGKNAGHVLTYKNTDGDPEDVRRVQEIEQHFQPKSLRNFPTNPDVKQLQDRQMGLVDDGTDRYLVLRISDKLYRVNITEAGDFVQVAGDTMTGQLTSTVAAGAPPYVVASGDKVEILNVDQVDGFDLDQSLLTTDTPEFVSVKLSGLTPSRLLRLGATGIAASVIALSAWIAGTVNQITVADDGDGSVTLSLPQDIHTGASPTFDGLTLTGDFVLDPPAVVNVTAVGGITVTASHMMVQGDGGAVDISADPQISAGTDGPSA
jgi:hypothetical protein